MNESEPRHPALDERAIASAAQNRVAFSGGPDSVCLLHLLLASRHVDSLQTVHIDHALDAESAERAERARAIAVSLGAECRIERLDPARMDPGAGPEAAAREARYRRLQDGMAAGDHLLTAHHLDDQVETLLLRLLRGAGARGLAGMEVRRRFGPGWLGRPLLAWPRAAIIEYLEHHRLPWIEDPSNDSIEPDRNFLRHEILPRIGQRWPAYRSGFGRSIAWLGLASDALEERSASDFTRLVQWVGHDRHETIQVEPWLEMAPARGMELIRHWCSRRLIAPPPADRLVEFHRQCRVARGDRQPEIEWANVRMRSWSGRLWLDTTPQAPIEWSIPWPDGTCIALPGRLGRLELSGPRPAFGGERWQVTPPQPGDRIRSAPDRPARRVAELLRETGVPPWKRVEVPCVRIDGALHAVGARWRSPEFGDALDQVASTLRWHGS